MIKDLLEQNFKFVLIFLSLPYILWFLELAIVQSYGYFPLNFFTPSEEQIFYFSILYPILSLMAIGVIITSSILLGKDKTTSLFIISYFPILFISLAIAFLMVLENFFLISYSVFAPWSLVLAFVFPVLQFLNQMFSFAYLPGKIYEISRKWIISIILGISSFAIIQVITNFVAFFYLTNTVLGKNYEIPPFNFVDFIKIKWVTDYSIALFYRIIETNFVLAIVVRLLPIFVVTIIIFLLSKKLGVGKETIQ